MPSLRHLVLFRFRPGTPPERITEVVAGFGALSHKIAGIERFEWGVNTSPEGKDKGLTHCFLLQFVDAAARDAYLPHPAHMAFSASLRDAVEDVCVVDYVPGEG